MLLGGALGLGELFLGRRVCSVVSGTILAASAIGAAWATTNSMNALTSGRPIAFSLGYMNSGRESGL